MSIQLPNYTNFDTAFNPQKSVPYNGNTRGNFTNNKFVNNNDVLHNNLRDNLLNEEVREYSVIIDSKDRNYQVYTNPFQYEVKFKPLSKSREQRGSNYVTYEEPAPVINDSFKNVKYIKLEMAILPIYTDIKRVIKTDEDGETIKTWEVDKSKMLSDKLY